MFRKLVLATLFVLGGFVAQAQAACPSTYVSAKAGSSDTQNVTTTGVTTTGCNLIVSFISDYAAGGAESCVMSDSKSATWTKLTTRSSGVLTRVATYYTYGSTVGTSHTFTAACNVGQYPSIVVIAIANAKSSPFDQQNGAATTGATSLATGAVVATEGGETIFTGVSNTSAAPAINSGFTIQETLAYSGTFLGDAGAYLVQGTAASINPTWSNLTGSDAAAEIATFKMLSNSLTGAWMLLGIGK